MGEFADDALDKILDIDEIQQRTETFEDALATGTEELLYDYDGSRFPGVFSSFPPEEELGVFAMPKKAVKKKVSTSKKLAQPKTRPEFVLVHGMPGVGKTSFGAFAPKPLFIIDRQEEGILDLISSGLIPRTQLSEEDIWKVPHTAEHPGWSTLLQKCDEACFTDYETVVFDSLTGFEKMCFQDVCNRDYDGNYSKDGFLSFYQGPKAAAKNEWPAFLEKLADIRDSGKNVILIAHSKIQTIQNPMGPDYDSYKPYLDKETWQVTSRVAETILFLQFDFEVTKERQSTKLKGKASGKRCFYTEWTPAYEAKNRANLPPVILVSDAKHAWENFMKEKRSL